MDNFAYISKYKVPQYDGSIGICFELFLKWAGLAIVYTQTKGFSMASGRGYQESGRVWNCLGQYVGSFPIQGFLSNSQSLFPLPLMCTFLSSAMFLLQSKVGGIVFGSTSYDGLFGMAPTTPLVKIPA